MPPQAWLDAFNQYQNEERNIEYVALGPAQAGDIPQPTADELSKYFNERKILFRAPEYRKIDTVTVTPAELAKWMEVSDDDLKKAYEQRRSRYHQSDPAKIHCKLYQDLLVTPSQHVAGHDGEKDAKAENLQRVSSNESDPLDPPVAQPFMVSRRKM